MPFGLKNVGAIYQRLVKRMFENQIGQSMEVYMDDMMVITKCAKNYIFDLDKVFP